MARKSKTTIQAEVNKLLLRRTPLTYEQIVSRVHEKHPDCHTTVKTVQWYASRLRKTGADVRVRTSECGPVMTAVTGGTGRRRSRGPSRPRPDLQRGSHGSLFFLSARSIMLGIPL